MLSADGCVPLQLVTHIACATSSARASPLLEEVQAPEPQGVSQRGAVATRSEPRGFV